MVLEERVRVRKVWGRMRLERWREENGSKRLGSADETGVGESSGLEDGGEGGLAGLVADGLNAEDVGNRRGGAVESLDVLVEVLS